jgi:C4-dicarboxylate-specific signal transduction histidine kinase
MVPRRWDELPVEGLEDPTRVLAQRMRIALLAWLAPIFLFGLADLFLAHRGALAQLYALKLFGLIAVGIAYAALRATRQWRTVLAIALLSIALIYALSTASAIIDGEDRTIPILSLAGALATATLLPWGVGPQLAVVALAALSPIVTSEFISGSAWNVLSYPNVGMAIGLIVSVWVAGEFERSRRALAEHNREQQRAEAAVRRLNEELEGRVAERTAELEQANSAMHEQIAVRVEAEAELQRSRAALSALIENTDDAIWSIDRSYRVTAFNTVASRRFSAVFGIPLFVGCLGDEFMPAQARTQWRARYDRGLAGERFSVEHAYDAPSGTRHFLTSFNPIVSDGAVAGLAIFSAEVTERKRAEEQARQHQAELTHVLRLSTMGEMAAGLAHEINQPLAAIVNYAQGSSRRLRNNANEVSAVLPVIDDIAAEALRAGEIIRRLRSLVRKETPKQDWIDLPEVAEEILRLVQPDTVQHGIAVQLEAEPQLPCVHGDRIQIEQVILNLLRNAIDAMAEVEGERTLHVRIVRVGDTAVELAVRDSGHGMAPRVAERVFDPFFSTKPGGLGMGLSISRTIIEVHQGRLWVAPNPDAGVTFHLTLPVPAAPTVAMAAG